MLMSNDHRFKDLLDIYLCNQASPDEYRELMEMIKSGIYDDILKQKIQRPFDDESQIAKLDFIRSRAILYKIFSAEKNTERLIPVSPRIYISKKWSLAASFFAIAIVGCLLLWRSGLSSGTPVAQNNDKKENSFPQRGQGKYIRLPDGSTVLLNKNSDLDYPESFNGKTREVTLIGEGYFDIVHNPAKPFIVHTGKVETTVLGTAFNVMAYPEQKEITVTVTRGKVKVGDGERLYGILLPNEQIAVSTKEYKILQTHVDADQAMVWKKQYLVFDNLSLAEAATLIDNKYHVNIVFADEKLKEARISATFLDNEDLEQVLNVITGVVNAKYTRQPNDQVILKSEKSK